ncbi:murein biosynthesis integral membrane protein MurJ [Kitasatospora sp. NPDC088134]|uniref:murein biosynthesis integral membrane protein MurJ n=1 Tax=Kitasatospora sp. NPDC088134 TaxID=3364071 RepID=UPI003805ADC0
MHTTDGANDPYGRPGGPALPPHDPSQAPSHGLPNHPPNHPPYDPPTVQLGRVAGPPPVPVVPPQAPPVPAVPPQRAEPDAGAEPDGESTGPAAKPAASTARNGMIMALGSLASRALGFVRSAVLVAALTTGPVGEAFNVANSLPNIVYMMLIGGALASVFVPELVHAMQTHRDGGQAYIDRLLTLCTVILVVLTVGAWLFAPQIVDLYSEFDGAQRDLAIAFARYCLPQIFFYGVFTLLGQVLNARDRFGAMMWTPVLNNVVAIAVFGIFLWIGHDATQVGGITSGDTLLLGLGSTLGIVVQAAALLPSLRSSGFRYRPRFDWKGAGLTRPLRSAGWALLLVVATQLSFAVVTSLSTGAGAAAAKEGIAGGHGFSAYTNAYQLFMVPQGVITISMVTALLPGLSRAAAAGDYRKIGEDLSGMLRSSAAMIVTASVLFVALAPQIAMAAYGYGSGSTVRADAMVVATLLMAFAVGLPAFCAQYALARGFYAINDARTPFWMTLITTASNAVLCLVAYETLSPRYIVVGMAVAHSLAALVSVVATGGALGRRLRKGPAAPAAAPAASAGPSGPDATLVLRKDAVAAGANATVDFGVLRGGKGRSGLAGGRLVTLHLGIALACLPGALAAHWVAGRFGPTLLGSAAGLAAGSLLVLVSLFVLALPLGVSGAVSPFARRLRIPYPSPTVVGKHRR